MNQQAISSTHFYSKNAYRYILNLIEKENITLSLVSSSAIAHYTSGVSIRRFVDFVDVDSDKWRQYSEQTSNPLKKFIYKREYKRVLNLERDLNRSAEIIFVISKQEKDILTRNGFNTENIVVAGNGVDIDRFRDPGTKVKNTKVQRCFVENPYIIFLGAMDYWPNVNAVTWFAEQVWPTIVNKHPSLKFLIVGSNPVSKVKALARIRGCRVTGRVDKIEPYLENTRLMVAPIKIARGVQNKVLEGMAAGVPVVTTPEGAEGIDAKHGEHLFVCRDSKKMAETVNLLLDSENLCYQIGRNARKRIRMVYSWSKQLQPFISHMGNGYGDIKGWNNTDKKVIPRSNPMAYLEGSR